MLKLLRTILVLGRMSNLPTVWTNVMVAWFLSGGTWSGGLWWMMAGVSLLYIGGMTLNDAFDAKWDAEHAVDRPIPSGAISVQKVWVLGWAQILGGILLIIFFTHASWQCWSALIILIVLYDWSHKRWKGAPLLMGGCRFFVYLLALPEPFISGVLPFLGLGLFLYIVGITIAARGESTGGAVGWLGKGLLLAPLCVGAAVLIIKYDTMSMNRVISGIAAIGMFVLWLGYAFMQLRSTRPDRIGKFVSVLLAGIILVDLIALAQIGIIFWPICASLIALTVLAQRWIPAT